MDPVDNDRFTQRPDTSTNGSNHDNASCATRDGNKGTGRIPTVVPPYWSHRRLESYASVENTKPPPITLEDHTEEYSEQSNSLWARGVSISDHVLVTGNLPAVGGFVVWNCTIDTIDGGTIVIRKRYSEFHDLREKLLMTFPNSGGAMPPLPPKSLLYNFRPNFLEKRRIGLVYFLNCILLNPDFSSAPVTKDFIFS